MSTPNRPGNWRKGTQGFVETEKSRASMPTGLGGSAVGDTIEDVDGAPTKVSEFALRFPEGAEIHTPDGLVVAPRNPTLSPVFVSVTGSTTALTYATPNGYGYATVHDVFHNNGDFLGDESDEMESPLEDYEDRAEVVQAEHEDWVASAAKQSRLIVFSKAEDIPQYALSRELPLGVSDSALKMRVVFESEPGDQTLAGVQSAAVARDPASFWPTDDEPRLPHPVQDAMLALTPIKVPSVLSKTPYADAHTEQEANFQFDLMTSPENLTGDGEFAQDDIDREYNKQADLLARRIAEIRAYNSQPPL